MKNHLPLQIIFILREYFKIVVGLSAYLRIYIFLNLDIFHVIGDLGNMYDIFLKKEIFIYQNINKIELHYF